MSDASDNDQEVAPSCAIVRAIEALLFASGSPLDESALAQILGDVGPIGIRAAIEALARRYEHPECGLRIVRVSGGWQMRTAADLGEIVTGLRRSKPVRLSRAALEALAIVAYEQPVSRADVEALRGVDSSGILRTLLELDLVRVVGRREAVGRPLLYGTSEHFLHFFSLDSLDALPRLREVAELEQAHLFDPDAYDSDPEPAALAAEGHPDSEDDSEPADEIASAGSDRETSAPDGQQPPAGVAPPAESSQPERASTRDGHVLAIETDDAAGGATDETDDATDETDDAVGAATDDAAGAATDDAATPDAGNVAPESDGSTSSSGS